MKKVLSVIMVMTILLTSAVGVFAAGGTKFIEQARGENWTYFLTENGCVYKAYVPYYGYDYDELELELVATGATKINPRYLSDLGFGAGNSFYLDDDGTLTRDNQYETIDTDVVDFNYSKLYRKSDNSLYDYIVKPEKVLDNCSDVYGFVNFAYEYFYYAKTNDGKWYHWGNNNEGQLEPPKMVDGYNITPKNIETPTLATEYIYRKDFGDFYITWKVDGNVYIENAEYIGENKEIVSTEKIFDNTVGIAAETTYPYFSHVFHGVYFVDNDGDVCKIDLEQNITYYDTRYADPIDGLIREGKNGIGFALYCNIDRDGNIVYFDKGMELKRIYTNYKYLNCSDWAVGEIESAENIGYIDSVKLFDMQGNIKREDFCNMIVDFCEKYLGKELSTTSNPFKDTENEKVIKAYANGIITGTSSNSFSPNEKITREQMCTIMTRAAKFLKPDIQFGEGIKFSDMHTVSDWAVEGVNAMSALGIVKGDGYSITPQSNTSVEQAIAMTYRLYNKIKS